VTNIRKQIFDMLIVQLVQGNISRQNALVTISTKSLLLLLKMFANFEAFVAQICLTLLVFGRFRWLSTENVCRRKPRSCTSNNTVHC